MTQLAGLGKPFVLVQMGGQRDDAPFINHPNVSAILWGMSNYPITPCPVTIILTRFLGGYPGQAGGDAIMNVLTGKASPAGRLPVTQYPAHYVNDVVMTDMSLRPNTQTGNPGRTYMWYDKATVPFGFGLHYTHFATSVAVDEDEGDRSFDIADLTTSDCGSEVKHIDQCLFRRVPVTVSNMGNTTSDFVVLGFVAGEHGPEPYPIKRLIGYQRLHNIEPGQQQTANLTVTLGSLGRRDEDGNLALYPGFYSLLVDVPTQTTWNFTLKGEPFVLDEWPQDMGV